jgi:hypothetical protein
VRRVREVRSIKCLPLVYTAFVVIANGAICETQSAGVSQEGIPVFAVPKKLAPSAFRALPPGVRSRIERDGCLIPQNRYDPNPRQRINVITGQFAKRGQTDWAILCWKGEDNVTLKVYWGGPNRCPEISGAHNEFDDIAITRISIASMRDAAVAYEQKIPPLTHEGINEGIGETGAVALYCDGSRWLNIVTSD